jgi:hypothetical protein
VKTENCKSKFSILEINSSFILIEDEFDGNQMTVTNDAENVTKYLYDFYLWHINSFPPDDWKIFYKDTDGNIDTLLHTKGVFNGFKPGHEDVIDLENYFL